MVRCDLSLYFSFLFQVLFNLATQYANNDMYAEALNTYQVIVKNKRFSNAGGWEKDIIF